MTLRVAAIIIGVGAFGCALAFFLTSSGASRDAEHIAAGVKSFGELESRFRDIAKERGGAYAFEVLRLAKLPANTDLHLLGHVVGDELYKQEGVNGIAICTQEFRNACSHSIVIGTLNEFGGEPALEMIREACKKAPGGSGAYTMCYHGLGHGVFAFFGYDLSRTVGFCKKTGTGAHRDREYIECVGGAVMELMGGGGHDREKWLASREKYLRWDDPLSPCMSAVVPRDTKELCLIYLTPHLWELAGIDLGSPDPELFAKAFAFCDVISKSEQNFRDACYGGFGKEFVPLAGVRDIRNVSSYTDDSFAHVVAWCTSAGAPDGIASCVAEGVASVFWGGENDPDASFRYCAEAQKVGLGEPCYRRLASDIMSYAPPDARTTLCARVPALFRSICSERDI